MHRLLIDGYSLLYREAAPERPSDMRSARERLIRRIDRLCHAIAPVVELVFDGRGTGGREVSTTAVALIYSPAGATADSVIERMVMESPDPAALCVVTSDRAEREVVTSAGAACMSCASFLEWLDRLERDTVRAITKPRATGARFTLGAAFPET